MHFTEQNITVAEVNALLIFFGIRVIDRVEMETIFLLGKNTIPLAEDDARDGERSRVAIRLADLDALAREIGLVGIVPLLDQICIREKCDQARGGIDEEAKDRFLLTAQGGVAGVITDEAAALLIATAFLQIGCAGIEIDSVAVLRFFFDI